MIDDDVFDYYKLMSSFVFKGYFFIEPKAEPKAPGFGSTQEQQISSTVQEL